MTLIQGLFLAGCLAGIVYHLLGILAAGRFHRQQQGQPGAWTPPVSILKPVRGADPHAFANFLSFCRQEYLQYEILFGVQDPRDPAIPVIRDLQSACPEVPIRLIIDESRIGANLKVCNLHNLVRHARHEVLVIADSDVRVGPEFLARVVAPLRTPRVGLVTCPYNGVSLRSLPAALEALSISTVFLPGVFFAADFGRVDFAFGAAIALRRSVLKEIGGFSAIADYLADDFQLGNRAAVLGYRVVVSTYVVESVTANAGFGPAFARLLRWSRTVRICRPHGYLASIITHSTFFGLAYFLATRCSPAGWLVFGAQQFCRWLAAGQIAVRVLGHRELRRWFWLLPVSDLLNIGLWVCSWLGNQVSWRGVRFRLVEGGRMIRVDHPPPATEEERWPVAGMGSSTGA
ncbi:MAG: bacteriohopanetetrol glucosamine biosynthesis glycosyltransferase HpnI [Armatimonadetes bacterium]|nr:bacteriohopanetetrol glucosamine biosynthesis glycosyltransferase HpnI [Armatimonadota bacterium]